MTSLELDTELESAGDTGTLHLSYRGLSRVPPAVWSLSTLVRLDLGNNELRELPPAVATLTSLEELWLNSNPLESVPLQLSECSALKYLLLQDTEIVKLPRELGRLASTLIEVNLDATPRLKPALRQAYAQGGTIGVLALLAAKDGRRQLLESLIEKLQYEVYAEAGAGESGRVAIRAASKQLLAAFAKPEDEPSLRLLIRNAARLLPERLDGFSVPLVRARLEALVRDNARKQLAADLELALRAIYYDRIDPTAVEGIVRGIAEAVTSLEDMVFLLHNAKELLPASTPPSTLRGPSVAAALLALRARQAADAEAAVAALAAALAAVYPDRDAHEHGALAAALAARLPSSASVRALAADAPEVCPPEWANFKARTVLKAFTALQQEKGVVA